MEEYAVPRIINSSLETVKITYSCNVCSKIIGPLYQLEPEKGNEITTRTFYCPCCKRIERFNRKKIEPLNGIEKSQE
jgi:hypothetical protein